MALALRRFAQAALGAATGSVYAVPAEKTATLKHAQLCNTTAAPVAVRVHSVPVGGSAGAGNALVYDAEVPANGFLSWDLFHVMSAGEQLHASGDGVTLHVSGVEQ